MRGEPPSLLYIYTYIYICTYLHTFIYVYICIYTHRVREGEREGEQERECESDTSGISRAGRGSMYVGIHRHRRVLFGLDDSASTSKTSSIWCEERKQARGELPSVARFLEGLTL